MQVKVDLFSSEASHTTSNVSLSSIFIEEVISFPFCTHRVLKNTHSSFNKLQTAVLLEWEQFGDSSSSANRAYMHGRQVLSHSLQLK